MTRKVHKEPSGTMEASSQLWQLLDPGPPPELALTVLKQAELSVSHCQPFS
jgi:hypothetical protein